jgi:hypothetical protein
MRRNLILVTSLIAAIALAAIILPLDFVPQNNKIQAQAQTQASKYLQITHLVHLMIWQR